MILEMTLLDLLVVVLVYQNQSMLIILLEEKTLKAPEVLTLGESKTKDLLNHILYISRGCFLEITGIMGFPGTLEEQYLKVHLVIQLVFSLVLHLQTVMCMFWFPGCVLMELCIVICLRIFNYFVNSRMQVYMKFVLIRDILEKVLGCYTGNLVYLNLCFQV